MNMTIGFNKSDQTHDTLVAIIINVIHLGHLLLSLYIDGWSVFVGVRHGCKDTVFWPYAWLNQTQTSINIFQHTYRFCVISVLIFVWRVMEQ